IQYYTQDMRVPQNEGYIVDIKTKLPPYHSLYPFNPSRENIKYNYMKPINNELNPYLINNVSGKRAIFEDTNEVILYNGKTIGEGENDDTGKFYSSIPSKFSYERMLNADEENPIEYEFIVRRV